MCVVSLEDLIASRLPDRLPISIEQSIAVGMADGVSRTLFDKFQHLDRTVDNVIETTFGGLVEVEDLLDRAFKLVAAVWPKAERQGSLILVPIPAIQSIRLHVADAA